MLHFFSPLLNMSTPPPIPKTQPNRGRPPKITLEVLYNYMKSVEKIREKGEAKIQIELETLEKRSEERDLKLKIELEAMIDKKKLKIPLKIK